MLRFSLGSLRAKLQIFSLVLVIVPGLLFAVISLVRARDALEQAVGQQLGEVAHGTLEELALDVSEQRNNIRNWTHQDVMRDVMIGDLDKRVSRFLRSLIDDGAPYLDLLCIDRTGRVVASAHPRSLGQMLGERDWARAETYDLTTGIAKTVDWYLAHREWCSDITSRKYARERLGTKG